MSCHLCEAEDAASLVFSYLWSQAYRKCFPPGMLLQIVSWFKYQRSGVALSLVSFSVALPLESGHADRGELEPSQFEILQSL